MRTHSKGDAARLAAVFAGLCLVASAPVGLAADAPAPSRADPFQARIDAATLELYALETQLARARDAAAALSARQAVVARDRESARKRLAIARSALRRSQAQLAQLLRALYEQTGNADPLAIVLGAGSLEEAITGLDSLSRAAGENDRIVVQAAAARKRLARLDARLALKEASLKELTVAANARATQLEAAAAAREGYLAGLRRELNARRVAAIQARAAAARVRTEKITAAAPAVAASPAVQAPATEAAPAPEPEEAATAPDGSRTLTVEATGYALRGRTATGVYTAHGVVAVDPSVIPLGTRMTIPGYGEGIAADTGGAVHGNIIDLWFPSVEQALQWGRRTVTIVIHE